MSNFIVRKVAVLGAGVMGTQIAAHLANAEIPVVLFDLPAKEGDPNGLVKAALATISRLEPSPIATVDRTDYIDIANYAQHLDQLRSCDLVIEAITEKAACKADLYRAVAPFISSQAVVASNTSGLSIALLAEGLPDALRERFCGMHFFNPPRYMPLVELISSGRTSPALLDELESWLVSRLGKSVVRALDTPNFVANRVGLFSMLAAMHHAERFGLGFDVVDMLTGPLIGRPKSASFRTADVVGLDTLTNVIAAMRSAFDRDAPDPWSRYYTAPSWLSALISQGALGQKAGFGVYRKKGKQIQVFDLITQAYRDCRDSSDEIDPEVMSILKNRNAAEKFGQLRTCSHPQAKFLWAIFRDLFHYVAFHLADIADNARDLDLAMRWGYGWAQGPFETWQSAGWQSIADAVQADIDADRAMSTAALPAWVFARVEHGGVHRSEGSYSARGGTIKPPSTLPVYRRQLFPDRVFGEEANSSVMSGTTIWENEGVRLWTLPEIDNDIAIVSLTSKNHTLGHDVLLGMQEAVARAEADYKGLVIWHEAPFAYGANLKEVAGLISGGQFDRIGSYIAEFQKTTMTLKYARVPVVAAVQGMALGGGCEFLMHCAKRVIALESRIGLVEAAVGLIPAGGGCKEFAIRAWQNSARTGSKEPVDFILPAFTSIVTSRVSGSAMQAREQGFVLDSDPIVFNAKELPYVALRIARGAAEAGYYPRLSPRNVKVAGRAGIAACEALLADMNQGGRFSEHDCFVARCAATALCGGDIEAGSLVDEQGLLSVELNVFLELVNNQKSQQRIQHLLDTGKPLRN
ncbi:MAG: 3-hydroxyacyl-CoA dehydrogenase/enoyl-CoA hydratase family protein [Propionivibrio sp.]|uniref:3-hydroxyacyl-CoA dehydrogenase/enoyl-CoA hydratase family protein n=1 Tax=Propionivibrio sp. TaxID=2212460 RepID=UPI0025F70B67|nr:3-hydroxyacyl-CoA dehydrogenase/enoyl-CoA hydratase family protein [Propionivibrio sp.]MBL0208563.1 3-hydroxyacyl-CoA dehydrogenase/enoyl-CoA hydratase family protein [Propionivibrio sp.]